MNISPARAGIVFRYDHAEQGIHAESASLWAFVFTRGIEAWAADEGLDGELLDRVVAERKRAAELVGAG